jgi:two-component system phosphate regulon sensor histidine kinase PhoR
VRSETRALSREKAFLASVTHELRTPLAAIRLFGETLSEGRGDPQEYGALVAQESERLEVLVERVLAVTRVDERMSFTRLDPADLVRSAVALIADRAQKRAIQVTLDKSLQEGGLPNVSWDADSVRRALLNLLDNAVKHGRQGGRIDVRATLKGDSVRLAVADDGPGIERRDRKRVFGRFQRGVTEAAGTGLGLYVVDQIARAHGGRVDLETEENRGATFTLILPIEPPEAVRAGARKGAPA